MLDTKMQVQEKEGIRRMAAILCEASNDASKESSSKIGIPLPGLFSDVNDLRFQELVNEVMLQHK
ncbi:MAG: hypothetical protein A2452_08960 [Candidatus Firestonebacteria bacterium RIFOXYC2_FULL_39_67]|nr:MAG: hypothetical protein A2536_09540 [Candidatus Firestonebacteria bacterium RIFOXYD2_FULL_39_29]OGF53579.1 MAG: hypothetical protein A2452_08960 [Candidatus Firestonebacteria bacterium RIFOXYC2_FULL_39_67]